MVVIAVFCLKAGSMETLRRIALIYVGFILYVAAFSLFDREFRLQNALIALVTYGALTVICVIPSRGLAGSVLNDKIAKAVTVILIIEALVGIFQSVAQFIVSGSFDLGNGDHVQGTINPSLDADFAFANPMFAVNVAMLLLYLWSVRPKRGSWRMAAMGLGVVVLVLASVLHLTILAIVAVSLGSLFGMTGRKALVYLGRAVVVSAAGVFILGVLMPRNMASFAVIYESFSSGRNLRVKMVERALLDMPADYAQLPIVGLGLGQFNSRAALMSTGRYFVSGRGQATDLLPVTEMSPAQDLYFRDLWESSMADTTYSSVTKPFFSWLSIYTELGGVGLIAVVTVFCVILRGIWRNRWKNPRLAIAAAVGTLLFAFLGSQENYWEVPQAILVGLMLLKLIHANLLAGVSRPPGLKMDVRLVTPQMMVPSSRGVVPSLAVR